MKFSDAKAAHDEARRKIDMVDAIIAERDALKTQADGEYARGLAEGSRAGQASGFARGYRIGKSEGRLDVKLAIDRAMTDALLAPVSSPEAPHGECRCVEIQAVDARRHFKGCPLREPLPEAP